jgi:predicted DNA-binding transcriptional regulator YafY
MRASRLVSIVLLLQARRRLTAAQLAAELEVSVRTIYRDVDSLALAGVPVYGEAGADGGYQLVEGYRTELTGLTGEEADVLLFSGMPDFIDRLGLGAASANARLKMLAALSPEHRERAVALRDRFHLDAPGWYRDADPAPNLAAVIDAVWRQRSLRIGYRSWAKPATVTRTVDPLGVVLKAGTWYLVARAPAGLRTYRVSEIERLEVLETGFDRPEGFSLAEHWRAWLAEFDRRRHQDTAIVRVTAAGFARLSKGRAVGVVDATDPNGWRTIHLPIESVEHASTELLAFGTDVEVIGPPDLRARLAETARELARMYTRPQA